MVIFSTILIAEIIDCRTALHRLKSGHENLVSFKGQTLPPYIWKDFKVVIFRVTPFSEHWLFVRALALCYSVSQGFQLKVATCEFLHLLPK